ncbi:MAG: sigma-70 family RNA polymerase sigma factor [Candidatus Peribacteraceae bacterium]|nr:sigma-70 family RNA polymerase sigma factor [Candidatus Peribacteraceae bacterium]
MANHHQVNGREQFRSGSERVLGDIDLYYRDIRAMPILTNEEELVLFERWKNGDRSAGNDLVHANLRLVADIALDYCDRGLPFEDLVQEGNLGLLEALEHFDPSFKTRFSSYAYFWAERFMLTALSHTKMITVPAWARGLPERWNRARRELQEKGGLISDEAVARRIGYKGNFDQVMMTIRGAALERDTGASAYQEASKMDGVRRPQVIAIEREQNDLRRRYLVQLMEDTLTECEVQYLIGSFDFIENNTKTGSELARKFKVSMSTINKHRKRALDKLRTVMLERLDSPGEQIPDLIVEQIL